MTAPQTALRVVPEPGDTQERITSSVIALADISGVSHAELAVRAEIDADKLSKSLNQKRKLTLEEAARLAVALDVPMVVLYDGGIELRRRAREGVMTAPSTGPDTTGGQEMGSTRWLHTDVVDLEARRNRTAARAA